MTSSTYFFPRQRLNRDEAKALCSTSSITKLAMMADIGRFGGLRYRQPVLRLSRTFLAFRNPLKNFGLATMLKLLKILFKHRGIYLLLIRAMGCVPRWQRTDSVYIPYHAKTANTYVFDKLNVSLVLV